MKKFYFICICSNLLLLFQVTNGGLAKGIFGTVHDTAHKIHDDIHNVFHPKDNDNTRRSYPATYNPNQDNIDEPKFTFAVSTTTPKVKPNNPYVQPAKVDKNAEEIPFVFVTSSTTEVNTLQVTNSTVSNSTTERKDGRENFAGGCSPGRKRTEDGRCEVKF